MNITTTENIIRQVKKQQDRDERETQAALDRKPVMRGVLKKGQKVMVYLNPFDPKSESQGVAQLLSLKDGEANIKPGFETWNVRFVDTGDEEERIVGRRHVVTDEPARN
jgi:hypothetical protein